LDLIENEEYRNCCLIKATKQVLDKLELENRTLTQITSKERIEQRLYHPVALREAVINAIIHNDYSYEVPPKFELFADRLEITSAGAIPQALSVGDLAPLPQEADHLLSSDIFDEGWYLRTYPDLRAANGGRGVDGAAHYLAIGAAEGRDPGPKFSSSDCALVSGGALASAADDYLRAGCDLGRMGLPDIPGDLPQGAASVLFFGHQAKAEIFGAERSLLDMLDRAISAGLTPSAVLPQMMNDAYLAALKARCHRVYIRPYGWIYGGVSAAPQTIQVLADLIRQTGARAVHQNTAVLDAPMLAARVAGVPAILHLRELPADDPALCLDLGMTAGEWRARLLDLSGSFVANSQATAAWLDTDAARVTIVPNRVDVVLFDLPFAPVGPPRVALIGSLSARKGVDDMAALARAAQAEGLNAQFQLIGPASPDLAALGTLPANLRHIGYVASPVAAMQQADIVLSLSQFAESFGRTVLEAMAAGRPVICYDRGTPPDLIGRDGTAGCVTACNPVAVLAALRPLVQDAAALQIASIAARTRARILQSDALRAGAAVYAQDLPRS
jgi:glycosyltransferase involved in cell wall biosynthesis